MSTSEKKVLLELIEQSECHDDLSPFMSLLPFEQIKSILHNHIKNELNHNDEIRKEYYNRVNIEEIIPEDLLISIIKYLSFKEMSRSSIVSKTIYQSYKIALNQQPLSFTIDCFDEYFGHRSINTKDEICFKEGGKIPMFDIRFVNFNKFLQNNTIKEFVQRYWKRITHLNISNSSTDFKRLLKSYDLQLTPNLKSFMYLFPKNTEKQDVDKNNEEEQSDFIPYDFGFITYGKNLEFVLIALQNEEIWNILITNCPNLHCVIFYISMDEFLPDEEPEKLCEAPNLWSLTVQTVESGTGFSSELLGVMLSATPNLYHLCIDIDVQIIGTNIILPTKNLMSITIGTDVLVDQCPNIIDDCKKLKYLSFPWYVMNEEQDDSTFILYKILSAYINNQGHNGDIYLGVTQNSEQFEDSVVELIEDQETDGEEAMEAVFEEFRKVLVERYECNQCIMNRLKVLIDDELNEEETVYAKKLGINTMGLDEDDVIRIRPENILKFVTEKVLDKDNEFAMFVKQLFVGPVIDDLFEENIVL